MSLYEYIIRVEKTHRKRIALEQEEKELVTPLISDRTKIREIYGIYTDEAVRAGIKPNSSDGRRIFIFIIIRLFCPDAFSGRRLRRGVRNQLAAVLRCEGSIVSHDFKNITFYYKRYRPFRETVNEIYDAIMETLSEN